MSAGRCLPSAVVNESKNLLASGLCSMRSAMRFCRTASYGLHPSTSVTFALKRSGSDSYSTRAGVFIQPRRMTLNFLRSTP
ncbi:MAG: hypothetical protein IKP08_06265 [Bacteroidales bacterium]|nr:hypothetical protein [Bacteroidales bacterium]